MGMMNTRPPADFLAPFKPLMPAAVLTLTIPGEANAHPAEVIAGVARAEGFSTTAMSDVAEAVTAASAIAGARVLVCGSLYLAGDVLARNETLPD
jgi:dihydrofolate synthase/folylpolyglutamate synthase